MEMETLKDLYVDELKDLWSAEKQIIKGLERMSKAASHPELKQAFQRHAAMTEKHVERLERICADLDVRPRGKKCVGMEGLIEEARELTAAFARTPVSWVTKTRPTFFRRRWTKRATPTSCSLRLPNGRSISKPNELTDDLPNGG